MGKSNQSRLLKMLLAEAASVTADPWTICLLSIIVLGEAWSNTCLNFCVPAGGRSRGCAKWLWGPVSSGSHSAFDAFCVAYSILKLKIKTIPKLSQSGLRQTSYMDFRCFYCNISDTCCTFKMPSYLLP